MPYRAVRLPIRRLVAGVVAASLAPLIAAQSAAAADPVPSCATAGIGLAALGGPNFYIDSGASPAFTSSYTGYRVTNSTGASLTDTWVSLTGFSGGKLALGNGQAAAEQIATLGDGASAPLFWYLTASGASDTAQGFTATVYQHDPDLPGATPLCTQAGGFDQVSGTIAANANKVDEIVVGGGTPTLGSTFTVTVTGNTGTIGSGISGDPESLWMSPAVTANWPARSFRLISTNLHISPDGTAPAIDYPDTLRVANLGSADRPYTATYTFRAVGFTSTPTQVKPVQEIASGNQVKHTGGYPASIPAIASPTNTTHVALSPAPAQLDLGGGQADYTATVYGTAGAVLDSLTVTPPAGATFVSGSATFDGETLPDPAASDGTLVFTGPFTLPNSSVTLTFDLQLAGASGDQVTSFVAGLGSAIIGTDPTDLAGSTPATATVNVDTAPEASDFSVGVPAGYTAPVDVLAHATDADGDPLTVVAVSQGQYGAVALGDDVTYISDGEYLGPDSFTYTVSDGRGGTAQATVNVNVQTVADQTITFPPLDDVTVGATPQAQASADSGLPIVYTSLTTEVCTVDTGTGDITTLADGTCTVAADQPGDARYAPAEQVTRSFSVTVAPTVVPQAITVTTPGDLSALDGPIMLDAQADSGLPVTYTSTTPDVCTVDADSGVVTLVGVGTCTIEVTQGGDGTFEPAQPVDVSFAVGAAAQTLAFTAPEQLLVGPLPYWLAGTSSAGLPVAYTVKGGDEVCAVNGDQLTLIRTGACVIKASSPASGIYAAAVPIRRTVYVVKPMTESVNLPPTTGRPTPSHISVLANDPGGLTLSGVSEAAHGTVTTSEGEVIYTPDVRFRGTDRFTYEVTDRVGRTATAQVNVTVRNAAPTARDATLRQVAGTTAHVQVPARDLNADPLSMTVVRHPSGVRVRAHGPMLAVTPDAQVTGRITVTVAVHDGAGGVARARVTDTVRPQPVATAHRTLTERGTRIAWPAASARGAGYVVRVNGHVVCTTHRLHCHTARLLGPGIAVTVTVRGNDSTHSLPTLATPRHGSKVLVGTVYFASAKWTLDATQRAYLRQLAQRITSNGFGHVQLAGYTDSQGSLAYNLHLSHQRTATVARILRAKTGLRSSQSWYGEKHPAVDGAAAARNRRVEIYVSY